MKTAQEIFDTVAVHLLTQRERALDRSGGCRFRGDNGLKCAVGCLIPDDKYLPEFENWRLGVLLDPAGYLAKYPRTSESDKSFLTAGGFTQFGLGKEHLGMLEALQLMHDTQPMTEWRRTLFILSKAFTLSDRVLEGLANIHA